jgi:hypothetical protein
MAPDLRMVERHCVVHRRNIEDRLEELSIANSGSLLELLVRLQKYLEAKTEDLEGRFGLKQEIQRIGVERKAS